MDSLTIADALPFLADSVEKVVLAKVPKILKAAGAVLV
jgi:hypothetical protein